MQWPQVFCFSLVVVRRRFSLSAANRSTQPAGGGRKLSEQPVPCSSQVLVSATAQVAAGFETGKIET